MSERQQVRATARWWAGLAAVPALVAATALVGALAVLHDRLPERALGVGGFTGTGSWAVVVGVPAAWILLGGGAVASHVLARPVAAQRWEVGLAWAWPVHLGLQVAGLIVRNLAPEPPAAAPVWSGPAASVVAAALLGGLGWWLAGPGPEPPVASRGPAPAAPRARLRPRERAVWVRPLVCRRRLGHAAGFAVLAAFGWVFNGHLSVDYVLVCLLVLAVLLAQVRVRVRVDGRGVRVEQPLLGRTLVGVDLAHVVEASAQVVEPGALPPRFGVIGTEEVRGYRATRGGELLRLATTDGRDFVVTAPDAASAAALVNAELDRRAARTGPC